MTSTRVIDRSEVLHRAVDLFWRKGYAGTSVQDLVEVLGLHRASLYENFGSKEDLFAEVVGLYSEMIFETLFEPLGGDGPFPVEASPRERLHLVLEGLVVLLCKGDRRGCLVESALVAHHGDLGRALDTCNEFIEREERKIAEVIAIGQERNEFSADTSAEKMARTIRAGMSGICFFSQLQAEKESLLPVVDVLMRGLDRGA